MTEPTPTELRAYQLAAIHDMQDALHAFTTQAELFETRIAEDYPIDIEQEKPLTIMSYAFMVADLAHTQELAIELKEDLSLLANRLKNMGEQA